ncbi:lycopene cyclase domain-containing protein [Pyruvatibacter mobilis]|uniref:lycopene cyclase domain-containing protein n=1 Tax=Pyruvatibacter mobilis TaxID=1712261 RepID=UPI003BAC53B0
MIPDTYVWLVWSSAFLAPWAIAYIAFPAHRRVLIWSSLFTTPFGLTEPLFVPEYWSPPSLFDLAQRTGFDIESLIFCFGIGGIGAVLYNLLTRQRLEPTLRTERRHARHRFHVWAIAAPFVTFPILYLLPWNPIYPAIAAMAIGAAATVLCRPDLVQKTWIGGLLFLAYYVVFLIGLEWTAPGYIARVWNLEALSGLGIAGMPVEELLFAITFGAYWSGVYEHFTWKVHTASPVRRAG